MASITSYRLAFTDSLMTAFKPRGAPGRWNSAGVVMVYSSEHQALAALEILNSWETYTALDGYHAYSASFDESLVETADLTGIDIFDRSVTQKIGDTWVSNRSSVVLRVASVVVPIGVNYLLNPNHPDFYTGVQLTALGPFRFDRRIEQLLQSAKES
jgi:RES domain-containing protein